MTDLYATPAAPSPVEEGTLLHCPIRGRLNARALAKDNLTPTEEARRIEFLRYLLKRRYPAAHIAVETVVLRGLGEGGRNKLRCDVIVYDRPVASLPKETEHRLGHAVLVAEIKRDSGKKASGVQCQLKPAMLQLPGLNVVGAYWDDVNRALFVKRLVDSPTGTRLEIEEDSLANLPAFGAQYRRKPITLDTLTAPDNLVSILFNIANIMRSHGVNDEHVRYKETVKLLLARYCDEKEALKLPSRELALQVYGGADSQFWARVTGMYRIAGQRYSKAQTLFKPRHDPDLEEKVVREMVALIQGISLSSASSDMMQQVFMSFVPAVFKKSLDQYFTPSTLIETMVEMVDIGPNDKMADPAMGTADFLTAAMDLCARRGETDAIHRVFGADSDAKAFDLAVVNMILNKDGQSNLVRADSIADWWRWSEEMNVVLCNPPFGARTVESRAEVLQEYDLGYVWTQKGGAWEKSKTVLPSQQLGLLFIERCYKALATHGRLAIILPEGYLCTPTYGYVRQWLCSRFRILSVVELPRRIFAKSDADLRSNVLVAQKLPPEELKRLRELDYPIHADIVRKVGFKMGKGFAPLIARDDKTGLEIRDENNRPILDSDFGRVSEGFATFRAAFPIHGGPEQFEDVATWGGARVSDILHHPHLDMKPRRLVPKALANLRTIRRTPHVRLDDIAEVVESTIDVLEEAGPSEFYRLIEGQDIRAVEGTVLPQFPARAWEIAERKARRVYAPRPRDIVVGLVRPERRNVGMYLVVDDGLEGRVVAAPDGVSIVRIKPEAEERFPQEWLFAAMRSEACRVQLWTESGGTSYGKLTRDHILNLLVPVPSPEEIARTAIAVRHWAETIEEGLNTWQTVGSLADRRPIVNSAIHGLDEDD